MTGVEEMGHAASLARAAKQGDADAAAELITLHLPYWVRAAHAIVNMTSGAEVSTARHPGRANDAADLVQDATLKLLELWQQGKGPDSNVRAYVTSIMRNAHTNRLLSPRSRERRLEDAGPEPIMPESEEIRLAELHRELATIRAAFARLPADYQAVLQGAIMQGQKPVVLAAQLDRSASAVSNLLVRAKRALHREMLIVLLSEGGDECETNAQRLPKRVDEHFERFSTAETDGGWQVHLRACEQCQRNWRRFAAISTALGVLPLVAIAQIKDAAIDPGAVPAPQPAGSGLPATATQPSRLASVLASKATSVSTTILLVLAAVGLALHLGYGQERPQSASGMNLTGQELPASADEPNGTLEASLSGAKSDILRDAVFDVQLVRDKDHLLRTVIMQAEVPAAGSLSLVEIQITFSPGTSLRGATNGLDCEAVPSGARCEPGPGTDVRAPFAFEVFGGEPGGRLELSAIMRADETELSGFAEGYW